MSGCQPSLGCGRSPPRPSQQVQNLLPRDRQPACTAYAPPGAAHRASLRALAIPCWPEKPIAQGIDDGANHSVVFEDDAGICVSDSSAVVVHRSDSPSAWKTLI